MIDRFAQATGDFQFIHVDPEKAKDTPFGTTIAHGFFTLSLLGGYLKPETEDVRIALPRKMSVNYGLNKVRFMTPVPSGKRIRVKIRLLEIEEAPDGNWVQMTREQTVELEGAPRPAMVAHTISRIFLA